MAGIREQVRCEESLGTTGWQTDRIRLSIYRLIPPPFVHPLPRLITAEGDKTVKMWREVEDATPDTHPGLPFRPPKEIKRF